MAAGLSCRFSVWKASVESQTGLHLKFILIKLSLCVFLSLLPQMTAGLCVCVILAVLCTSCLGLPFSSQPLDEGQRSASAPSEGTTSVSAAEDKPAVSTFINNALSFSI